MNHLFAHEVYGTFLRHLGQGQPDDLHCARVCVVCFQELSCESEEADEMPEVQETVTVIPGSALLWRIAPRPAQSAKVSVTQ